MRAVIEKVKVSLPELLFHRSFLTFALKIE